MRRVLPIALLMLVSTTHARAETPLESGVVMTALQDELARAKTMQLKGMQTPYYAAFEAADQDYLTIATSLGAVVSDHLVKQRNMTARVRIGDYANDSSRFQSDAPWLYTRGGSRQTSIDDRYDPIRRDAWLSLDASYKSALSSFAKKSAVRASQETSPDRVDDFSHETPTVLIDSRQPVPLDRAKATKLARALSAIGVDFPALQEVTSSVDAVSERAYFVSSEGARVIQPKFAMMATTTFRAQADDGMPLTTFRSVATCTPDTMPSEEALVTEARAGATELDEIRRAPIVDDYSGPILFEGIAAPQLVFEVVSYSISGTPPPVGCDECEHPESELVGQVGQRVMPAGFRLEDDPTIDRLAGLPLAGFYKVDSEGIPGQKVTLVEDGIFKTFLMSRTPRKGFLHSNGHARDADDPGAEIGNLILSAAKGLPAKDLRGRLIAEAKAQKKPHALIVERLESSRAGDTKILVLWKLGLDGKATRVRGGSLADVPLKAMKEILAAGTVPAVSGFAGDGGHSITSPALLFKDLEVKRQREPSKRPPILPRPTD